MFHFAINNVIVRNFKSKADAMRAFEVERLAWKVEILNSLNKSVAVRYN